MARNEIYVAAPPAAVWGVLCDPESYSDWVVGSETIRGVDGEWPKPGSRFHHRVGLGPFGIRDHTEVLEAVPEQKLVLRANARPLGVATVTLLLEETAGGTHVTMIEDPHGLPWTLFFPPPLHLLVRLRNAESIRRLRRLSERALRLSDRVESAERQPA